MEVKDLFAEETLSKEDKTQIHKSIQEYVSSDNYRELVEYGKELGEGMIVEIRKEIKTRKKTELIKSELDRLVQYEEFLRDILERIDDSEGGKLVKKFIITDINNVVSNIEIRVDKETFFDAPVYSKADMLKAKRADYSTIGDKIAEYSNLYTEELKSDK